ncbi:MAG: aminotransferase class I/II-fold pyridoxal phosphate-dependent enzyme, partial [Acidobacteria bacterium]|nr:aminotransferase class I/II-fold pyridoxal phosphate-dependent enzyme [Acidobacteriota bacterium]
MRVQPFKMERWQSLHDHEVKSNLSESGVEPMSVRELVEDPAQLEEILSRRLGYGHTSGSPELRAQIAGFYPGATPENVLVTCGGAEANYLAFWSLLESGDRVAVEIPNYMQTVGLARAYGGGADPFYLKPRRQGGITRWALDLEFLSRAVTRKTRILLITNPHNPTGAILSEEEMEAIIRAARRVGAWIV